MGAGFSVFMLEDGSIVVTAYDKSEDGTYYTSRRVLLPGDNEYDEYKDKVEYNFESE